MKSPGGTGSLTSSSTVSLTSDVSGALSVANGGTGQTSLTAGFVKSAGGTTALTTTSNISLTSDVSGTLPVSSGGTGQTTYTAGFVKSIGGDAALTTASAVNLVSDITGTLQVPNGGTGQTSYTDGQLLIGNSTGNTLAKSTLTAGTGIAITNGAGSITIASTNAGAVTSVGGTGTVNGISLSGTVTSSGNLVLGGALSGVSLTSQVTGTLPTANGGTGLASVGAAGNILTSDGSAWISQAPSARSGVFDAIAFGALPNGIPVVLNSDGTVSAVTDQAPIGDPAAGTPAVFESANTQFISTKYDSTNQKIVIAYGDVGNSSYATAIVGTVSGTSISFGTPVVFESASTSYISATYDTTNQKIVIAYTDGGNLSYGTAVVFEAVTLEPNLTSSNFVGFSENSYSDSETATIQIIGSVNSSQSGLTIGSSYYVQLDGTLSTTPDTPSVFAGTAVSSTKIIVKG